MKRHRVAGNSLIPVIAVLFSLMALLVQTGAAHAAPITDCAGCHGMPPLDDATRNITTGGFQGNHQTHQPAAAVAANCGACHGAGVTGYNNAHRDGFIRFSSSINGSPATGAYSRGTSFAQSATPALGTCSNVNCHFEKVTPTWGSASFTYTDSSTNDCDQCHLAAPTDGNHPYGTQKHGIYYGTDTGSCVKCHSDHTAEANKFAHATSAGNRGLQVLFTAAPNSGGTYSGNVSYPNYLPSKSPARNGTCTNLYCHSPGNKATSVDLPNTTATWGGTLDCRGCHKADFNGTAGSDIQTGSHTAHVNGKTVAYNTIKCVTCHAVTATAGMTIATYGNHVDKQVQVAFDNTSSAAAGSYNGQLATPGSPSVKAPGSAVGQCSNVYCHSTGQGANGSWPPAYQTPTWGTAATGRCGTCHAVNNDHSGQATVAPVNSGSHTKHLTYTFGIAQDETRCAACHMTSTNQADFSPSGCSSNACHAVMNQKHSNYEINVGMPDYFGVSATYNGTTKPGDGYSSCSSVYCHSDGQATPTYAPAVTWGSGTLNCASCHGTATANGAGGSALSGKHAAHVNNVVTFGTGNNFGCVDCHQKTVLDNTTLNATTGTTVHVNKFVDYTGLRAGGSARYNSGTKQCSNIYCHSNGNATSLVYVNPAVWNSATAYGCNGCHGTSNVTTGAPDYASGGADSATRNSHTKHVAGAGVTDTTGCATCHYRTVDAAVAGKLRNYSTLHLNGTENVAFKVIAGKTGIYNADTTCSATYCHGTAASPKWGLTVGVPLACNTCHGASNALPGAHAQHWETATLATSYTLTPVNSGNAGSYQFNCSSCHRPGSSYAVHATGPAHANGAGQVFYGFTSSTRKGNAYNFGTTQGNDNGFTWTNGGSTSCATTYCHSNGNNAAPVVTAFNWASANGTLNCGGCHNKAGDASWSGSAAHTKHVITYGTNVNITCKSCHNLTAASNTAIADKTKHVNKLKDVALISGSYNGTQCANTYCHSDGLATPVTYSTPAWTVGGASCGSCHGANNTTPPASNTHDKHVGAAAGNQFSCAKCHARTVKDTADSSTFAQISSYNLHVNTQREVAFDAFNPGATYSGGTCATTYCHSSGKRGQAGMVGTDEPVAPAWSGTLTCKGCHGASTTGTSFVSQAGEPNYVTGGPGATNANSHLKHVGTTGASTCANCHSKTTTTGTSIVIGGQHVNKFINYTAGNGRTFGRLANKTCSNISCHSGNGIILSVANAQWGDTFTCISCHGDATTGSLTVPHNKHVNNAAVIATNFGCVDCHAKTVSDNTTISNVNNHGNAFRDYSGVKAGGSAGFNQVTHSCSTSYCHSSGKKGMAGMVATVEPTAPVWNATTLDCKGCHGAQSTPTAGVAFNSVAGEPNYTSGAAGTANANSHQKHVGTAGATTCDTCHTNTTTNGTAIKAGSTIHLDKFIDVTFNTTKAGTGVTWTQGTKTCSTACHGKTAPRWGEVSTGCNFCHPYDVGSWNLTAQRWTAQLSATSEGFGAHEKHITHLKTLNGISLVAGTDTFGGATYVKVCGACHTNLIANHIDIAAGNARLLNFGDGTYAGKTGAPFTINFGASNAAYNGASGTSSSVNPKNCLNTSCHTGTAPVWAPY